MSGFAGLPNKHLLRSVPPKVIVAEYGPRFLAWCAALGVWKYALGACKITDQVILRCTHDKKKKIIDPVLLQFLSNTS